jgi:hypothetical protein
VVLLVSSVPHTIQTLPLEASTQSALGRFNPNSVPRGFNPGYEYIETMFVPGSETYRSAPLPAVRIEACRAPC